MKRYDEREDFGFETYYNGEPGLLLTIFYEAAQMSDDNITADDLATAGRVNEVVIGFLRTRYLAVMTLIGILSPVIGILAGALVEGKIFSASRNSLLSGAKAEIAAQVEVAKNEAANAELRIRSASDEASEYLKQIRGTRDALDLVLKGTPIGDKTMLQVRSANVQKDIDVFLKKLKEWEADVKRLVPEGLESLKTSAQNIQQLEAAVLELKDVFDKTEEANALAGAFYKIYELVGGLEVDLFVRSSTYTPDFKQIVGAREKIKVTIAFYRNDSKNSIPQKTLEWRDLSPMISGEPLEDSPPEIEGSSQPAKSSLRFKLVLEKHKEWWNIINNSDVNLKRVDLRHISDFDTISMTLNFPKEIEAVQTTFVKCMLPRKDKEHGVAIPRSMTFTGNVNRVKVELSQPNDTKDGKLEDPYWGKVSSFPAVEARAAAGDTPAEEARDGKVVLLFEKTVLFSDTSSRYIQGLQYKK